MSTARKGLEIIPNKSGLTACAMGQSGKQASRSPVKIGGVVLSSLLNGFIVFLFVPPLKGDSVASPNGAKDEPGRGIPRLIQIHSDDVG
jgi:hypothetical protein